MRQLPHVYLQTGCKPEAMENGPRHLALNFYGYQKTISLPRSFAEAARILNRHRNSVQRPYRWDNPKMVRIVNRITKQRQEAHMLHSELTIAAIADTNYSII